ncbi:ABC transporter ATP-binding protein [Acidisoma cellulosilytica]|uniref:ABC transporter ATP-binding protein n=1 Tax=Acidisoma cellulosilyticum TaxID=2802395 RepID=A0A963YYH1_9PROT|nr:ABC transporter ATP-binding protein [Acidisoma cellulosilyticum]MCB8879486.1 ABC transporter ATP-binding protein [Acidisoma cellulosilyticum]
MQQGNEQAPLIRLSGVRKVFGGTAAIESLDLAIAPGEFFTFLGPSGSGKTTTLRIIAGFEQPDSGRIELDGQDLSRLPPHRRDVNTVFQDYALFPHLTLLENVAYGLRAKKIPSQEALQRAEQALASVQLGDFGARRPGQLSGGQRQRVALARAIVNRPRVLLLDEPLGALDLKLRHQMQVELKALQQQTGITFIYVTHDQDEALTMSDRIAVFNHGRVEQVASPWTLYEQPQTAFVAGFVGITNIIEHHGARFALRPEKIRLLSPDARPEGQEAIPATVKAVSYLGMSTRFLLHCADGRTLTVVEQNIAHRAEAPRLTQGSAVLAAWSAEAPWPLAA